MTRIDDILSFGRTAHESSSVAALRRRRCRADIFWGKPHPPRSSAPAATSVVVVKGRGRHSAPRPTSGSQAPGVLKILIRAAHISHSVMLIKPTRVFYIHLGSDLTWSSALAGGRRGVLITTKLNFSFSEKIKTSKLLIVLWLRLGQRTLMLLAS